jgi:ferredoxin-type protein NapH
MSKARIEVIDNRSWWLKTRWLVLRRSTQTGVLALFLLGPLAGIWVIKGNLNSSLTLDFLPLTDPFVLLQSWLANHQFGTQAAIGALIVAAFYFLIGGRAYCGWVCPVNIVTDTAHWARNRLRLRGNTKLHRNTRYWLLGASLVLSALTGLVAWEWINPVSVLHRGIIFGMGSGWFIILAVFLFDLAVSKRGWCSHLCPMGAFYSLLGSHSTIRIRADNRDACDKCMDCFDVCPEPLVISPALFGKKDGIGPVINEINCTNCGRCIDVCSKEVFHFGTRFGNKDTSAPRLPSTDIFSPEKAGEGYLTKLKPDHFEHKEATT